VDTLVDPDVSGAVEQPLDSHPGFGPGQRSARAAVDASSERDMLSGVFAGQVEGTGVVEPARITVGGRLHHHYRGPGGQVDPTDGDGHPAQPEVSFDRALDAQRLFDEVRNQAAVLAQLRLNVGPLCDGLHCRTQ
jgi:hypothetical protein